MIPGFVKINGCLWLALPKGIHTASLEEVRFRFAVTPRRMVLFEGLRRGVRNLQEAGCKNIYLDGSFVTAKPNPGDYDACWDPTSVRSDLLDPVFLDFNNHRQAQKQKFYGEYFPMGCAADQFGKTYLEFFQIEKTTGAAKGIIHVPLPV